MRWVIGAPTKSLERGASMDPATQFFALSLMMFAMASIPTILEPKKFRT